MLLVLTLVTFVVFLQIPANPGTYLTGPFATSAQLAAADRRLGLDHPWWVQYLRYLDRLVHGQMGVSYASQTPVSSIIEVALPITAAVVVGGVVLMLAAALLLGVLSAMRPGTLADRSLNGLVMAGVALHPIIVGLLLQALFVRTIPIAPTGGYCKPVGSGSCGLDHWAAHLALPWITFALYLLPNYARVIRAQTLDILNQPHVTAARARGASERRVLGSHVLRFLVPTTATMLAVDMSTALMAAIYIEAVFNLPGLGTTALIAQQGNVGFDLPVIVGVVTVVAAAVITFTIVADLAATRADPRIRLGRR